MTEPLDLIGTKIAAQIIGESIKNTIRRVQAHQLVPVTKLEGLRGGYLFDRAVVIAFAANRDGRKL